MPVITFANTKGGAGKTTAVLLVATELARMGHKVAVLDADPQHWITRWHDSSDNVCGDRLSVTSYVTMGTIDRHIAEERSRADVVLIDLPGARSPLLAKAIGYSNYVLIPVQGSAMDAQGGAHVIELLQYLEVKANIRIPHSVVLTRVNSMVTTRALLAVKGLLASRRVHVLDTPIIERSAYRDVFGCGKTLYTMDPRSVSNLEKAQENAQALAGEVMRQLPSYFGQSTVRTSQQLKNVA
ncbi:ParA family protein [Rhizobium sp. Root482]|uniref:ParA family protein n=1 Tax=Rhizobium sp. Root482 TaxID=1736543 RepID=UPI0007003779|nr:ParA family protein [Rhizobium sp. Root482]KQY19139.1 chromosome partitioning protein ParA [Rhizobium sp. Root482]